MASETDFVTAKPPGETPKIDSIFDFSAEALGQLKLWLEQAGLNIPSGQVLGMPTSAKEYGYAEVDEDTTTNSTTFVDLVAFEPTTFDGVRHYLEINIPIMRHSVNGGSLAFGLFDEGGTQIGNEIQFDCDGTAGVGNPATVLFPFTPDRGPHTYEVQWKVVTAGTATIRATGLAAANFRIFKR